MPGHGSAAGFANRATKGPGGYHQIVGEADHRDEIGDDGEGLDVIEDGNPHTGANRSGDVRVGVEVAQQPYHVGEEGDDATGALAGGSGQKQHDDKEYPSGHYRNGQPDDYVYEHQLGVLGVGCLF